MKVTQIQPHAAVSWQRAFTPPKLGTHGPGMAAFMSPTASPSAVPSEVAALAVPVADADDADDDLRIAPLLGSVFGSSSMTAKQLKGAALVADGLKIYNPALAQPAKILAVFAATQEVVDAFGDEDAGQWERAWKMGKLVVATGNVAADYADSIPGIAQAAPYLTAIGVVIKVGDGLMLVQPDKLKDDVGARSTVAQMQTYASGSASKQG